MEESKEYIVLVKSVLEGWYVKFAELTPKLIVGIVVFLFFYFTSKFFSKIAVDFINKISEKKQTQENIKILVNLFRFIFLLAGTFISFEIMGFSGFILKFIGSLGVAGIIAGVALKDIVSSMFSGVLVSVDKAFKVGDTVQINNITGRVVDIGFLTTKLISDDGKKYYVPNQLIFNAPFVNFTESEHRRISVDIEIPSTENIDNVKKYMYDCIETLEGIDKVNDIQVVVNKQSMGIFYLSVKFWLKPGENLTNVKSEAFIKIKERLDEEGVSTILPETN